MMVPSLSTSISSPSFFKDREDGDDEIDINQDNQNVDQDVNNQGEDVGSGGGGGYGDLSDLLIPSLNIPELLDELNQHSDTCSNGSLNNLVAGLQPQQQQQNPLNSSSNSNKSNSSIGSNGKRSLGYQIYRTFPYRGSLPSPLMQIINQLGDSGGAADDDDNVNKTKPKPCSTNALRHSRQYKGLQLNLPTTIGVEASQNRKSQELKATSPRQHVLDSSFFQPPVSPREGEQQPVVSESPRKRAVNFSLEVQFDDDSLRGSVSSSSFDRPALVDDEDSNNNSTTNASSNRWSQLMQSLDGNSTTITEEGSKPILDFGQDLDSLKNLSLDGISLDYEEDKKETDNNNKSTLTAENETLPSSFSASPISSATPHSASTNSSPIMTTASPTHHKPHVFIESASNASRIKGQLDMLGGGGGDNKKKGLSRTITFADPESIQHFFGDPTLPNKPFQASPPLQGQKSSSPSPPNELRENRPGRISLTSLFPKLPFNSNNNPSSNPTSSNAPSRFYYPLLQPQPTSLIRGYSIKADTNIRGLKRAKKVLDMEDEYLAMHPFGGDPQMALFCIFDGHSGKNCAVAAKEILPNVLLKNIQTAKKECGGKHINDMRGVFLSTFKETDAQLTKFEYEGATTTIVLIWRVGDQRFLQSANVGDSSSFLSYAGETLTLTKDHRVNDPEEQQRIRDEGVELGENQTRINGLMVSRALGDHFIKNLNCGLSGEPFISPPISLTPFHSHLIVASDGLWDVISGHRAMEMIKTEQQEEKMANLLLQCALKSIKSKDNISLIVTTL